MDQRTNRKKAQRRDRSPGSLFSAAIVSQHGANCRSAHARTGSDEKRLFGHEADGQERVVIVVAVLAARQLRARGQPA
jgi:hypothetical protein